MKKLRFPIGYSKTRNLFKIQVRSLGLLPWVLIHCLVRVAILQLDCAKLIDVGVLSDAEGKYESAWMDYCTGLLGTGPGALGLRGPWS